MIGFASALFVVASLWVLLAVSPVSVPLEEGEPCGGGFLNVVQKLIAGAGWTACVVGLVGGLGDQASGGRWIVRATSAAAVCFVVWILLISAASC